ncbi:MAG: cell division protein FtsA [Bdellovibrionales bacterium]|nr:cell division protein FtsA [Bdellovibrionales bacterium]
MARFKLNNENVIVSLDVGTSSIRCAVIQKDEELTPELLAYCEKPCQGLDEGRVVDFNEVIPIVGEVLEEAETLSKTSFSELWIGLSCDFHSFSSQGMTVLPSREVTKKDMALAIHTACAVPIPSHHIRIHNNPLSFHIDNQSEVINPLGLSGLRLETQVHIVTIPEFYCHDLTKVLKAVGCTPKGFIHNLVAFAGNLTDLRQKKNGVCLCDIGYRSSRVIVYHQGKIKDMFRIPFGGEHLSLAISERFKISLEEAEALKVNQGSFASHSISDEEQIETGEEGLFIACNAFSEVLEDTIKQFFSGLRERLELKLALHHINSGILWTGQTSFVPGFLELARSRTGLAASHPRPFISNDFKKTNTFAIAQEAFRKERLQIQKTPFTSHWIKFKDLF